MYFFIPHVSFTVFIFFSMVNKNLCRLIYENKLDFQFLKNLISCIKNMFLSTKTVFVKMLTIITKSINCK